ncbi:MAG TPA: hypothetical protein VFW20_06905 [Candidatus Limnocylindrales bacterium]|nr:hypothetical protein [Candidatus Limnocylindrales bacterium]
MTAGAPITSAPEPELREPIARQLAGALLVYLVLAFAFTSSAWQDPTNRWIGNCCDQEQTIWFLAWTPHAIATGQNPLLTDRLNAPDGANLMWNAAEPLVGLLAAPVTAIGGPVLAYNVAAVGAIALSGLAAFAVLRRFVRGGLGPLVGGALYELSPYVASHAALHLNLLSAWAPPLFLILFDELVRRQRVRPWKLGAAAGLVGAAQLLTSEEILATSAVAITVLAAVAALVVRDRAAVASGFQRLVRAAPAALVTFLALGGGPLAIQFLGPDRIQGSVTNSAVYSTDLLNVVVPTPYQLLAPDAATALSSGFSGLFHEATAYVGLPLLVVVAGFAWLGVARRANLVALVAGVMAIVLFTLSLGPQLTIAGTQTGIPMPWWPMDQLPLLENVVPGRLTLYMWLAIAVLVAIAVTEATRLPLRMRLTALAAIGAALVFVAPTPAASSTTAIPTFFRTWSSHGIGAADTVLFAPWFADGAGAAPMLWSAGAGAEPRMVEGYVYVPGENGRPRFGPENGQIGDIMSKIQDTGTAVVARGGVRRSALTQLGALDVADVVVGPMPHQAEMARFFADLLGAPPTSVDGVLLWRNVPGLVRQQLGAPG